MVLLEAEILCRVVVVVLGQMEGNLTAEMVSYQPYWELHIILVGVEVVAEVMEMLETVVLVVEVVEHQYHFYREQVAVQH